MIPLLLLALAVLVVPSPGSGRARLARLYPVTGHAVGKSARPGRWLTVVAGVGVGLLVAAVVGGWLGAALATSVAAGAGLSYRKLASTENNADNAAPDPLSLAAAWDLMAACLHAGLPVAPAVRAVATHLPGSAGQELRAVADRLALGAGPQAAWEVPESSPLQRMARAARRSAHTGAALAEVAVRAATDVRSGVRDAAVARGQRDAVLITGPLGLCFLPAFLALGVAPVVIGLARGLASNW